MKTEILQAAGIDYAFGVKRFVGRANLYEKALRKFSQDSTFSRVRAAYEAGDRAALLASAHEFKGMCGNIGLTGLFEAANELVQLLRSPSPTDDQIQTVYEQLAAGYQRIYTAVLAALEAE